MKHAMALKTCAGMNAHDAAVAIAEALRALDGNRWIAWRHPDRIDYVTITRAATEARPELALWIDVSMDVARFSIVNRKDKFGNQYFCRDFTRGAIPAANITLKKSASQIGTDLIRRMANHETDNMLRAMDARIVAHEAYVDMGNRNVERMAQVVGERENPNAGAVGKGEGSFFLSWRDGTEHRLSASIRVQGASVSFDRLSLDIEDALAVMAFLRDRCRGGVRAA